VCRPRRHPRDLAGNARCSATRANLALGRRLPTVLAGPALAPRVKTPSTAPSATANRSGLDTPLVPDGEHRFNSRGRIVVDDADALTLAPTHRAARAWRISAPHHKLKRSATRGGVAPTSTTCSPHPRFMPNSLRASGAPIRLQRQRWRSVDAANRAFRLTTQRLGPPGPARDEPVDAPSAGRTPPACCLRPSSPCHHHPRSARPRGTVISDRRTSAERVDHLGITRRHDVPRRRRNSAVSD